MNKIKVSDPIVNGVKVIFDQASYMSWLSTYLFTKCKCSGARFNMVLGQNGLKTGYVMIEANWVPGSMHAQSLLTTETVVAMETLVEGIGGIHVYVTTWLCQVLDWQQVNEKVSNLCRFGADLRQIKIRDSI